MHYLESVGPKLVDRDRNQGKAMEYFNRFKDIIIAFAEAKNPHWSLVVIAVGIWLSLMHLLYNIG